MFQTKFVEKIKTHILYPTVIFQNCAVCYNVKIYCRDGQATGENIIWSRRISYWAKNAKYTNQNI